MKKVVYFLSITFLMASCSVFKPAATRDDGKIDVSFVQINDVYEIAPLSGGKEGGVARVATLKKQVKEKNPNTYLVIAGDFLSPSVFNSMKYEGETIKGRQMVESLNAAGLDFAMFGNHEFDLKKDELQERLDQAKFQWISSNAFNNRLGMNTPFISRQTGPVPESYIIDVKDADGTTARVGLIAVLLPFNQAGYVHYDDPLQKAKAMYNNLKDSVDAVVALTHQTLEEDETLAREVPGLAAIIGGHEHDQHFEKIGNVYITKALANAKSAFVINLHIDKKQNSFATEKPELVMLDEHIPLDSATTMVVNKWTAIAEQNYSSLGFDAHEVLVENGEPLEGRETEVRRTHTNLTDIIVAAMMQAAPQAEVAILNGGSIRVDDKLTPPITQYDILRTLPFGGAVKEADIRGKTLTRILDAGLSNRGTGGFLHTNKAVTQQNGTWLINGHPIDPQKAYRVALAEFLLTGHEANLDFLNPENPDVVTVYDTDKTSAALADIRRAVVDYLKSK
ncbi:MAG: bifunctional metallophosphatase/5'-nucleotidase [Flavisolibacter sp.]